MTDGFKEETLAGFVSPAAPYYASLLKDWFDTEINREYQDWRTRSYPARVTERLLLGMLAFRKHAERFVEIGLPSLLASGNLDALHDPIIAVHTDGKGAALLRAPLERAGVRFELNVIPDRVMELIDDEPANKYWLLGAVQQLHLHTAKYRYHAYHALFPDHVFATGYFSALSRLMGQHPAILHTNLSADIHAMLPALRARSFNLTPKQLNALALDHLHKHISQFVMNGRAGFPAVHMMVFVSPGAVRLACPHLNVAYLSHPVLARVPMRLFNTLDADLAYMIPGDVPLYAPTRNDGMTLVELSDGDRVVLPTSECEAAEFSIRFWVVCHCNPAYERYFGLTTEMPLPENYRSSYVWMTDDQVAACLDHTRRSIANSRGVANMILPLVAEAFQRGRLWGSDRARELVVPR